MKHSNFLPFLLACLSFVVMSCGNDSSSGDDRFSCKANETYDAVSNACTCDAAAYWEGEAGSCVCKSGYVLIKNTCEEKQACRQDQVYVDASNTCVCPDGHEEQSGVCVKKTVSCTDADGRTYFMGDCYKPGDTLTFGSYPQDEDSDSLSPITWLILEINDDAVLLLSQYVLEQYTYHDQKENITWENSNIRSYLNGLGSAYNKNSIDHENKGFIDLAFTTYERERIKKVTNKNPNSHWNNNILGGNDTEDWVFLLSYDEVYKYFPTQKSRIASPTPYVISSNVYTCEVACSSDDSCSGNNCTYGGAAIQVDRNAHYGSYWWLRSPGNASDIVAYVDYSGSVSDILNVNDHRLGIRPAMYVYLSSEL